MSKKQNAFFQAVSVLTGTIIGAGIFGMPYVFYCSGFLTGILLLIVLTGVAMLIHLYIGEIVLSTERSHQLTGYAEKYLGKTGKYFMFGSVFFGFYGALLAYLIGEGDVLSALFGGSPVFWGLIFFILAALFVARGMILVKKAEFFMTFLILVVVFVIVLIAAPAVDFSNLKEFSLAKIFIPYGVILFSVGGASAVPQLREALSARKDLMKKSIIVGTLIPFAVYVLFTFMVLGVSGVSVTEVATIGLGEIIGKSMLIFGNIFAFFAIATSFLTLALALKSTYFLDFKIKPKLSLLLAILPPLIFYLLGLHGFVKVMGIAGAVGFGLEGILILLMLSKLSKKRDRMPEYAMPKSPIVLTILSLIFIGGIIFTICNL